MNKGRVGEDRGSKETDRCPLTETMSASVELGMGVTVEDILI
jgi:hypothetical protein